MTFSFPELTANPMGPNTLVSTDICDAKVTFPGLGVEVVPSVFGVNSEVEMTNSLLGPDRLVVVVAILPEGGGLPGEWGQLSFSLNDSSGSFLGPDGQLLPTDLGGFDAPGSPPPIFANLGGMAGTSFISIDSLDLAPVPEPSAITLLAGSLMMLPLLRRR